MNTSRKIYKVIVPVDRKDGKTHWLRVGSAFTRITRREWK